MNVTSGGHVDGGATLLASEPTMAGNVVKQNHCSYEFGPFRVEPEERLLLREGQPVQIKGKVFDTLIFLIQKRGHLVGKSEVMRALWRDSFVEESNLTVSMSLLRKALGDDASEPKYIQTVPRQGYRFVGDVREVVDLEKVSAPATQVSMPADIVRPRTRLRYWIILLSLIALGSVAAMALFLHFRTLSRGEGGIHSLAVLPFLAPSTADADDYLRLGLADVIITRLGSTGQITVRPTSAVRQYADSRADPLKAGRDQRVDAIVTGTIQSLPNRVRVTVQLVRVADGFLVWADTFQESPDRLFALEDEVAAKVAQSIPVHLSGGAKTRLARINTQNPLAYQLYLKGRYFWNKRTADGMRRSIEYFQNAIDEDHEYALAYAGLADSYLQLSSFGVEPYRTAYAEAKAAGLKALALDSTSSEAHSSLGMVSFSYEWNWSKAEEEFKRAIELDPNYAVAYTRYAMGLVAAGRFDEALAQERRALELDPLSLDLNLGLGRIFYSSHDFGSAAETIRRVIDMDPMFARAHLRLGMVHLARGSFDQAIEEFGMAQRISGTDPYLDGLTGYAAARSGRREDARGILEKLTRQSKHQYVPAFSFALVYIGLGANDLAWDWLEKAYQERSKYLVYAKTDPLLDPLRADPRFLQLLRKMGLA